MQEANDALSKLQTVTLFRPIRSPTALKRPDRSKQCHCLQFFTIPEKKRCARTTVNIKRFAKVSCSMYGNKGHLFPGHFLPLKLLFQDTYPWDIPTGQTLYQTLSQTLTYNHSSNKSSRGEVSCTKINIL